MNQPPFPHDLLLRYKAATVKLNKIQRVIFKRFAPNFSEVSEEFNQIAVSFNNSYLPEYAALCWLGAAKCEQSIGNSLAEVDYLLKSARASVAADAKVENLKIRSNDRAQIEAALRCYNDAISRLDDNSVLKAAVIREMKKIQPDLEITSGFSSPAHRIHDLETAANECILNEDYEKALEKYTEIYDDILERKVQRLYEHVLERSDINRVLLLLYLELPPSRQSPSNIKLLECFSNGTDGASSSPSSYDLALYEPYTSALQDLVKACQTPRNSIVIQNCIKQFYTFKSLSKEQHLIIARLLKKYQK